MLSECNEDYLLYTLFYENLFFIRTLMLRFDQKFKKMYGMKEEHP